MPNDESKPQGDASSLPGDDEEWSGAATGVASMADGFKAGQRGQSLLKRGDTAGRYVILDELGAGGMGVVYQAYDPELDRRIALKIMKAAEEGKDADSSPGSQPSTSRAAQARDRLLREAQALAQLSHPNVVSAYDVGVLKDPTIGDQVFMAMELVEGKTLTKWIREDKPSLDQIVKVMTDAGRGIAAAHRAGLVHRDFKPDNVIVGKDGRVRVLDFGLAKSAGGPEDRGGGPTPDIDIPLGLDSSSLKLRSALTMAGAIVGSPGYMAPEQCLGETIDDKSDQFSFCATLYHAVYGQQAFSARSWRELKQRVVEGRIEPPPSDRKVPSHLRRIIYRGLAVAKTDRYPSMEALLADLSRDPRAVVRRAAVAALILLLAGAGAALVVVWRTNQQKACQGAQTRLEGVWDDAVKKRIESRFTASGRPYARDTFERIRKVLDERARQWVQMRTEACEATRIRGEQSEQLMDLRMQCLEDRLGEIQALCELFAAKADGEMVDRAVLAVSDLGRIGQCADAELLTAALPLPQDPSARAGVDALRARLLGITALERAGRYREGLEGAQDFVAKSRSLGYAPLNAEVLYELGRIQAGAGDPKSAEESLYQALLEAGHARDPVLLVRATAKLIDVIGSEQARASEALTIGKLAEASVAQAGSDPLLEADTLYSIGQVQASQGNHAQAEEAFAKALAIREKVLGADHPLVAETESRLGREIADQGRAEEAHAHLLRALQTAQKVFGADHPEVARKELALRDLEAGQTEGMIRRKPPIEVVP